jgi:hypothetical protein
LSRRRRTNGEFPERMATFPNSVLMRKKSGGGVEEDVEVR